MLVQPSPVAQPMDQYVGLPIEVIPKNLPLPYSLYIRLDNRMILFRSVGDTLVTSRADRLKEHEVTIVYVDIYSWDQFLTEQEINCEHVDASRITPEGAQKLRGLFLTYVIDVENKKKLESSTYRKVHQLCERLLGIVITSPRLLGNMLRRYNTAEIYLTNHTTNVAIYSAAIAMKLQLPKRVLSDTLLAGFLHNLGLTHLPDNIVYKNVALNDLEWAMMRRHAEISAEIAARVGAPHSVIEAVRASHERMDGQGYANRLKGDQIPLIARILSIADVYDALLSYRHWAPPHTPIQALTIMKNLTGKFDPKIFEATLKK